MQLVQDGGFTGGIQTKHHNLTSKHETTVNKMIQAVRWKYNQIAKEKSRAKRSADPHLAGAEEGIEQLAERLPHRRTEINPSTREHQTSDRILELLRLLQVAGVDEKFSVLGLASQN
jgi:hypothetical protein